MSSALDPVTPDQDELLEGLAPGLLLEQVSGARVCSRLDERRGPMLERKLAPPALPPPPGPLPRVMRS